jgi:hypothetical protein
VLLGLSTGIAASLHVGEPELIYTDDEIPIRYDGSLSTIKDKDGRMLFFHSFGCRLENTEYRRSRHSWHTGPPDDPLKTHLSSRTDEEFWDYNGWYEKADQRGIWILGMYEAPDGALLGITHSEVRYPKKRQQFALGIGYSRDRGQNWTYCGEIVRPANPYRNVGGGAYHVVGDYLQVYYNDTEGQCMARAKCRDVLREAERRQVGKWHKHRQGKWDVPGLAATSGTPIFPRKGAEDVHSDAAYCTALERYLLTVQTHSAGKLLLYSSSDGIAWQLETLVDRNDDGLIQAYSTFVDFDGPTRDCHEVDGDFFIYFPRKDPRNHDWDAMFRVHVQVK